MEKKLLGRHFAIVYYFTGHSYWPPNIPSRVYSVVASHDLIYLKGQREARSDNCKAMVCLSRGVWKGMDKSVRTKSLLFFACFYYDKVIIFYVASPGNQPFSWAI